MNPSSKLRTIIGFLSMMGLLTGCAASGPKFAEVMKQTPPLTETQVRIVFLRPNNRYDDYSASEAVIRVNDQKLGGLEYGGFLMTDVASGAITASTSARNPLHSPLIGSCTLHLQVSAGTTVYLDVAPRTASVVAGIAGALAGVALVGASPPTYGVGEVGQAVVAGLQEGAVDAAGATIVTGAESAGKTCGGAFRLALLNPQDAVPQLENLSSSQ